MVIEEYTSQNTKKLTKQQIKDLMLKITHKQFPHGMKKNKTRLDIALIEKYENQIEQLRDVYNMRYGALKVSQRGRFYKPSYIPKRPPSDKEVKEIFESKDPSVRSPFTGYTLPKDKKKRWRVLYGDLKYGRIPQNELERWQLKEALESDNRKLEGKLAKLQAIKKPKPAQKGLITRYTKKLNYQKETVKLINARRSRSKHVKFKLKTISRISILFVRHDGTPTTSRGYLSFEGYAPPLRVMKEYFYMYNTFHMKINRDINRFFKKQPKSERTNIRKITFSSIGFSVEPRKPFKGYVHITGETLSREISKFLHKFLTLKLSVARMNNYLHEIFKILHTKVIINISITYNDVKEIEFKRILHDTGEKTTSIFTEQHRPNRKHKTVLYILGGQIET